jgi:hypothetical protein
MGLTAMTIATLMYVITAIDLLKAGDYSMTVVYGAYATANCGLIWSTEKFRLELIALARVWA